MISVLVTSAGIIHPSLRARRCLLREIEKAGDVSITRASSMEEAASLLTRPFDVLVLYLHRREISGRALEALDAFVSRGGGLMAVHSASASFKTCARYHEILGGRFTGHGKVEPYEVRRSAGADLSAGSVEGFTVHDELYIHEYSDDVTVQYYTSHDGRMEPVVWTRTHGRGHVFYCSLGHLASSFQNEPVAAVLRNGLVWAAAGRRS